MINGHADPRAGADRRRATADSLVDRLTGSLHHVNAVLPVEQMDAVRRQLRTGYIVLGITQGSGPTHLHVRVDDQVAAAAARPGPPPRRFVVTGTLTLDDQPLTCVAEINAMTLAGVARLTRRDRAPGAGS